MSALEKTPTLLATAIPTESIKGPPGLPCAWSGVLATAAGIGMSSTGEYSRQRWLRWHKKSSPSKHR
jgi:hypothetical protein